MRRIALTLLLVWLPLALFAAEPVSLVSLQIKPGQTVSHFIFTLSKKTYGRVKYIPYPDRVELELTNTFPQFDIRDQVLRGANVKSIALQNAGNGMLRFTFLVRATADYSIQFLPMDEREGAQLDLSIFSLPTQSVSNIKETPKSTQSTSLQPIFEKSVLKTFAALTADLKQRQAQQNQRIRDMAPSLEENTVVIKPSRLFIIAIDAGHGGKDSGALGTSGAREKDVVLGIAKKLAKAINQQPNMRAVLTRNGDYFVPLRERLALARKGKADLFVAVHADAYFDKEAMGTSVYALSQRGATNEAARWLAQRENYSELGGVELDSVADRDPIVRSVLVDLAQTVTMQDSLRLGTLVLDALDDIASLHHSKVERAPFVVLKSPDIPSILVETGFITNPREEKRLTDPAYQEKVAEALHSGIEQFVKNSISKEG